MTSSEWRSESCTRRRTSGSPSGSSREELRARSPRPRGSTPRQTGRLASGSWYLRNSADHGRGRPAAWASGTPVTFPVVGDWNGDGLDGLGVFRNGVWYLRNVAHPGRGGHRPVAFGNPGDVPVVGDWNGDGIDTIGVFRAGPVVLAKPEHHGAGRPGSFSYGSPGRRPPGRQVDGGGQVRHGRRGRDAAPGTSAPLNSTGIADITFAFGDPSDVPAGGGLERPTGCPRRASCEANTVVPARSCRPTGVGRPVVHVRRSRRPRRGRPPGAGGAGMAKCARRSSPADPRPVPVPRGSARCRSAGGDRHYVSRRARARGGR